MTETAVLAGGWRIDGGVLDFLPLLGRLADGSRRRPARHCFTARSSPPWSNGPRRRLRRAACDAVALSGGCFLNKVLTEGLVAGLAARGIEPLVARAVPPNDGGLSLGQAFVAASALLNGRIEGGTQSCATHFR